MALYKKILFILLVCLTAVHWPSDVFAEKNKFLDLFHGSLFDRFKLRTTDSESDIDNETRFTLNIGDVTEQKMTGHLQAGALFDLNGVQGDSFDGIYDSFESSAVFRLYYAYLNGGKTTPFDTVRIGRQHNYEFESFYFDGAYFDLMPFYGFKLSAYAGKPVHLYENQFGLDGNDFLVGSVLTWTPVEKVRLRFDAAHLRDEASAFRATQGNQEDSLLGATVWVDPLKNWDLYGRFTSFLDQARDFSFATSVKFPKEDLRVKARVYRLLQSYDVRVPELDIYGTAGTYQQYTDLVLDVLKGIGKHFSANGGFGWRLLDSTQTASAFNHGYKRGYLTLNTSDIPIKDLSLSATADYYHGEDSTFKNNYFGGSFYASKKFLKKKLVTTVGTAYYLYRFNFAIGNESNDVQTVYAKVEAKLSKKLKLKTDYEYEHNSLDSFHTFNFGLIQDF